MRPILTGFIAGAAACVFAVAVFGVVDGYSNPEGYPPGLFPALPRPAAAGLQVLAYFGLLAGAAGGLVGGGIGVVIAAMRWLGARRGRGSETAEPGAAADGGA